MFKTFSMCYFDHRVGMMAQTLTANTAEERKTRETVLTDIDSEVYGPITEEEHRLRTGENLPSNQVHLQSFDIPPMSDIPRGIRIGWLNLVTNFYPDICGKRFYEFTLRQETNELPENHPHAELAYARNAATKDIIRWSKYLGKPLYDKDSSRRTQYGGNAGDHDFHTLRDFSRKGYIDRIPSNAIISFIDCDYYHDDLSNYAGHDMVLFTFRPRTLAGSYGEGTFSFLDENTVRLVVRGGPQEGYRHPLWNYSADYMRIQKRGRTYVYRVDSRSYTMHHDLVVLSLVSRSFNPFDICFRMASLRLNGERGTYRLQSLPGGGFYRFVLLESKNKHGLRISKLWFQATGVLGFQAIEVKASIIDALCSKAENAGGLMAGDIQGITDHKLKVEDCTLLSTIFRTGNPINNKDILRYTLYAEEPLEGSNDLSQDTGADEVTNKAQRHCADLTDTPAGVPNDNMRNEQTTQQMRVEAVRNETDPTVEDPRITTWCQEFVTLLFKGKKGKPLSREEVILRQDRPMQKGRNKRLGNTINEKAKIKTFLKTEPVDPTKPARQIGQFNTEHCIELSRYTYVLKDAILSQMNHARWYAPGKSPEELHKIVGEVMARAAKAILILLGIDYSKYDGSQSKFLRMFEHTLYLIFFGNDDHLAKLLEEEVERKTKGSCGLPNPLRWSILFSRVSGSPLTTDGNTIVAALIAYCYHRAEGRDSRVSWNNIGLKGGDDGIDMGDFDGFKRMATGVFGMKVTGGQFEKGWVPFYSRIFIKTEVGVSSFCDPLRALNKWHLGMNKMLSPAESLMNKTLGYEVTDKETIIIGDLIKLIKSSYPALVKDIEFKYAEWSVKEYLMYNRKWKPEPVAVAIQSSILGEYLGLSPSLFSDACRAIRAVKHVDDLSLIINVGKGNLYAGKLVNTKFGHGFVTLSDGAKKTIFGQHSRGGRGKPNTKSINNDKESSSKNRPATGASSSVKQQA